jgi:hypothetical protein
VILRLFKSPFRRSLEAIEGLGSLAAAVDALLVVVDIVLNAELEILNAEIRPLVITGAMLDGSKPIN